MKKTVLTAAIALAVCPCLLAEEESVDSLRHVDLDEAQVLATRASKRTPMAFVNVDKQTIQKQNTGLDIPFLLQMTPSVLTTTDAGAGVGYSAIRVRGTDATRINVTTNGIPMNDAESHSIYWVNTPDLASSLKDIQVQRGVGSSANGAGAFGGNISMQTDSPAANPMAAFEGSYGSFNTQKETFKAGTGLMRGHWTFDARLSHIRSDGYRDRASAKLKSYFLQAAYYAENTTVRLLTFGGKEDTYHAWDGIDAETLKTHRKYNPNGEIKDDDGKVVGFYDNQTDIYKQTHYQLLFSHNFNAAWNLNVALHYTDGDGYYEEYKNKRTLVEYGLQPFVNADGVKVKKSNLVRRKNVDSGFGGGVFSLNYQQERLQLSLGGAVNKYKNDHDGRVVWVKNYVGELSPNHTYYENTGEKEDATVYGRANVEVAKGLSLYADLQYRHLHYSIDGRNDNYDWNAGEMQRLDVDEKYDFFNPKAGLFWQIDAKNSAFASVAVAHKEPTRNQYTDGFFTRLPGSERLTDYEVGYAFANRRFTAGVNLYYMDYADQLVLTGQLNEIGEAVAENVKESYRCGVELTAGVRFADWLRWDVNATLSRNRIKHYTEYLAAVDADWNDIYNADGTAYLKANYLGSTPITMSPDFMLNSLIAFECKGMEASLQSQYVGRQYLNNSGDKACSLDSYFVSNLRLGYTFKLPTTQSVTLGVTVYNLFNETYESNGYASRTAVFADQSASGRPEIVPYAAYYPNAGTNVLANIALHF